MTGTGAIGTALLIAAVAAAVGSMVAAGLETWGKAAGAALARPLLWCAAALLVAATLALAVALVTNDFSLTYVADHSRRAIAAPYRLAGLWGGMEGSLLFWTTLLAVVAAIGARTRGSRPAAQLVLAFVVAAFALTTLAVANPFVTLAIPALDGGGLMPILEHPAMLYHPPLLYLGLVLLVVPFARTVAALFALGRDPSALADDAVGTRRWMTSAWTLLALAMAAGANWAYAELGWGGYWAWDPIENSALLPWLAATAYLHARQRRAGRGAGGRAAVLSAGLVVLSFVLAAVGAVLTRSGAASSVHAFGQAEAVGRALSGVALVLIGVGLVSVVRRWRAADAPRASVASPAGTVTRSTALLIQVVLVVAVLVLVLIGTLAPLVLQLFTGDRSALDGSYFASVTAPVAFGLLLLCGIGPRSPVAVAPSALLRELRIPLAGATLAIACMAWSGWSDTAVLALAGAAGFTAASVIELASTRRATVAASLAHLGFAVLLLGVAGSVATSSTTVALAPGARTAVGGVDVQNLGAHSEPGPPPVVVAPLEVVRGDTHVRLEPSIVGYPDRGTVLAETALWSTPREDVQVALRRATDDGDVFVEIRVRPLATLIWWGSALIVAGGVAALTRAAFGRSVRARRQADPAKTFDVTAT